MSVELAIPPLAPDEVHVWTVSPTAAPAAADAMVARLSPHEQHRAARMRDPDVRHAFVVGRARVREILGRYVGQPGETLDVVARVDARPRLAGAPPWLDFSFSRCDGMHVCAIGVGRRIGIDVQPLADGGMATDVADRALSTAEHAWLATQTVPRVARARLLTQKEAFMKAVGGGLTLPLTAFTVPVSAGDDDGEVRVERGVTPAARGYTVRLFTPAPGIVGAVAAEGTWRLTLLHYPA